MTSPLLDIKNVSLHLPAMDKPILSDINYQVNQGDFIIILGSNGSGKSSLLKLLDQRYHPTAGDIFLNNSALHAMRPAELSKKIITLTQNCHESLFTSLSIYENYLLVKCRQKTKNSLIRAKNERLFLAEYLVEFNPNLSQKLDQTVDKLSGGEKQALALALSVLYPPEILLLDEHTSALDPKTATQLMAITQRIVSNHHITCMLTTHQLDIAMQYGNRILALRQGEIYQKMDYDNKMNLSQQDLLSACY